MKLHCVTDVYYLRYSKKLQREFLHFLLKTAAVDIKSDIKFLNQCILQKGNKAVANVVFKKLSKSLKLVYLKAAVTRDFTRTAK